MKTLLRNFELFTAASIKAEVRNMELLLLWKNLGRKVSPMTHFGSHPNKGNERRSVLVAVKAYYWRTIRWKSGVT